MQPNIPTGNLPTYLDRWSKLTDLVLNSNKFEGRSNTHSIVQPLSLQLVPIRLLWLVDSVCFDRPCNKLPIPFLIDIDHL